jgi:hypothetical protein
MLDLRIGADPFSESANAFDPCLDSTLELRRKPQPFVVAVQVYAVQRTSFAEAP